MVGDCGWKPRERRVGMRAQSARAASLKIMAGTIIGGIIGFYVMHRLETSYKQSMQEKFRLHHLHPQQQHQQQQQLTSYQLDDPDHLHPDIQPLSDSS